MALNETILGQQLYSAIKSKDPAQTLEICKAMAKAIVEHVQQNGEVTVVVQTSTGSGTGTGKMS